MQMQLTPANPMAVKVITPAMARAIVERRRRPYWEDRIVQVGEYLEWTGCHTNGYGIVRHQKREYLTHRVAWVLAHGEIPSGSILCHSCDNPPCLSLDHLFLGTNADNNRDMLAKGRGWVPSGDAHYSRRDPTRVMRGARHPGSKLDEAAVRTIRALISEGRLSHPEIGTMFGVGRGAVGDIARGRRWRHVS